MPRSLSPKATPRKPAAHKNENVGLMQSPTLAAKGTLVSNGENQDKGSGSNGNGTAEDPDVPANISFSAIMSPAGGYAGLN